MLKYFRLLDIDNKDTIVRAKGRSQQKFLKDVGWVESGIMIRYFSDESDTYDMYEEINEEKALQLIGMAG